MHLEINAYKTRFIQSFALLFLGFFAFSVADVCSKMLQDHYKVFQILAVSGTIGVIVTGTWLIVRHGVRSFFPNNLKYHLIRAVILMTTAFTMVSALGILPLADFYGVIFVAPFLLLILSIIFLKEKVGWHRWAAVCIAFSGVLILAGPHFESLGLGFLFALAGAMCVALNILTLRKIGQGAPMPLYAFYPALFIAVFNGIAMFVTDSYVPFLAEDLHFFALHGPVVVIGTICCSLGYAKAPEASAAAPFVYTQIIWGVLFGWWIFHVVPDFTTIIGLIMIIGAGCYSIWRDYLHGHAHVVMPD